MINLKEYIKLSIFLVVLTELITFMIHLIIIITQEENIDYNIYWQVPLVVAVSAVITYLIQKAMIYFLEY